MGFFEEIEQSTMLPRKLYKGRKSSMKKSRYVDFIEALCPNSSKNPRKFFGSAGYPNFQPIKKRSIARQRSIVIGWCSIVPERFTLSSADLSAKQSPV